MREREPSPSKVSGTLLIVHLPLLCRTHHVFAVVLMSRGKAAEMLLFLGSRVVVGVLFLNLRHFVGSRTERCTVQTTLKSLMTWSVDPQLCLPLIKNN